MALGGFGVDLGSVWGLVFDMGVFGMNLVALGVDLRSVWGNLGSVWGFVFEVGALGGTWRHVGWLWGGF